MTLIESFEQDLRDSDGLTGLVKSIDEAEPKNIQVDEEMSVAETCRLPRSPSRGMLGENPTRSWPDLSTWCGSTRPESIIVLIVEGTACNGPRNGVALIPDKEVLDQHLIGIYRFRYHPGLIQVKEEG